MADQITTSLAQAKILVMQGMAGKAPRINAENNHWEVYDNDTQTWVDTGVRASLDDEQIADAVEDYLDENPVTTDFVLLRVDANGNVYDGTTAITGAQINALAATKKAVFLWDEDNERLYAYVEPDGSNKARFSTPAPTGNGCYLRVVNAADNDSTFYERHAVPAVTTTDSGKVLTVNSSGQWAAEFAPVLSVNGKTGEVVIPLAQPGETHINVLNPAEAVQGYIAAQGQINGSDTYWTTGYIPVSEGDVLRVFYDGTNKVHAYAAEYSTNAQSGFISRTDNGSYASYTVQNDGYVRLSVKTSAVPWANVSTAMVTINDTDPTFIAYGDLGANDGLMSAADKKKLDGLGKSAGKKVFDKFLFIAYSSFGNNAPNSVPHFEDCAQKDYDWLKADVQPTSDGGLVCCHDSGFTLDGNGRITTYNASSATEIYTMTLAQATALVYASYPTTHVASIDDFLEVCKMYGKVPQITIRDAHMDVVVPALFAALDKFALRSVAVINSSARASLDAVRAADKDITMSLFVNPFGSSMASGYNYALADGNTMLGYFYTQSSHTWAEFIADSTAAGYIANCITNGIIMWAGIESDASHVDDLIAMGFSGIHTMQDRPYPSELPTVTAADNGKSLVVENGAWGKGYQAARIPRVAMTASDTTPTIDPNKLYVFPEMASLEPTFATPTVNTIVNEYHFIFESGATATTLTIPATIHQPDGFTVEANHVYEVSILEGNMTAQGWAVSDE